ncbi:MAG: prepilin-type N-terminal cleavage/methylation domain-containing protein, partial [Planctomycetes bacterium]|nr:prepilin-type N-terminal cleavage/methylation domain-containing protein [Planctomycetota bacterium]
MNSRERGFSLMEMMVSLGVMVLIMASVFQLLSQTQARSSAT